MPSSNSEDGIFDYSSLRLKHSLQLKTFLFSQSLLK